MMSNSSNLQASSMQLRKLQILKQQGKVSQLHRRDERSLIVDAITTARPDTKTAAYVCLLSRISPLACIASPFVPTKHDMHYSSSCRWLQSVQISTLCKRSAAAAEITVWSSQYHKSFYRKTGTPGSNGSATKWVHGSSRLALFFSCGAWLNHGFGDIEHLTYDENVKVTYTLIKLCHVWWWKQKVTYMIICCQIQIVLIKLYYVMLCLFICPNHANKLAIT